MKPLKFKAGRFYRTRDGRKAWVAGIREPNIYPMFGMIEDEPMMRIWTETGNQWAPGDGDSPRDLIAPWREKKVKR